ncbi:nucleotide excision repair factor [Paecilomyces variotii]|uniref:Nucleotide excision repair factor n=1 Tax=Byssochlamys spectabilis TaxID=264951 RepID=A0A443I7R1_BYSSP|nr:nucleotide excision repair factor [Paecilomyces variotii]KAJ9365999.1 hypothetical protein DTO280E4_295 [Paecilomyces variotii]RWR00134.1 nucleotide excision repair factor [Paecilomyces variotii]
MTARGAFDKEHPLAGVVLCFTSILPEQRTELATVASQMGATHKFDLTSDVTHLLVGETNTPKYKYVARERSDVVVLMPEWIEAVRQSWIQGGDTDIKALEEQYKFPTFAGLSICITGFDDLAFRNHIQNTATANGADFRKDLTKSVTHLIAREAEGQKYKFATQWNIKVVSVKWFTDSLDRGMILEETLYHPLTPTEKQGIGAWNRSVPAPADKRSEHTDSSNPRPRKLRRIASTKLGDQNEGIWGDIMGRGFDTSDEAQTETNQRSVDDLPPIKARSVIQEAKSFASETTVAGRLEPRSQSSNANPSEKQRGFLDNCYFFIHGFSSKQTSVLQQHLEFNGAQIVPSLNEFASPSIPKIGHGLYMIVPHKTKRSDIPSTDDMAFEVDIVTEMWLERCLDCRSFVPPESHVASTLINEFPIEGFRGMKICSTGFAGIDLLHLSKIVTLIGATYDEYLTPSASVLICNDPRTANIEKLRHTREWNIPAVSADWLWISIQTGQRKTFEPYLVQRSSQKDRSIGPSPLTANEKTNERPQRAKAQKDKKVSADNTPSTDDTRISAEKAALKASAGQDNLPAKPSAPSTTNGSSVKDPSTAISIDRPRDPSRSLSSTKENSKDLAPGASSERGEDDDSKPSDESSKSKALGLAVSGFLKQVRASSRASSTSADTSQQSRSKRRKPLLGRASSFSSVKQAGAFSISRASSIDTLNEDGCGSGAESLDTDTNNDRPPRNSRGEQSFNSIMNGKFDFPGDHPRLFREASREMDEEDEAPAMTQLNYEDPDAVAMREEFMRRAGKGTDTASGANKPLVVGEVRELEDINGWATGRRTRRGGKTTQPDHGAF